MATSVFSPATISLYGTYLQGELEKLDQRIYEPIEDFTWSRDIMLRNDVSIENEVSSFLTNEYFGGFGGTSNGKKSWLVNASSTPAQIGVNSTKTMQPMTMWAGQVAYTIFDLMKSKAAGRPIDSQLHDALRYKHQLDIDAQVYVGDKELGFQGLLNNDQVTKVNVGTVDNLTPQTALKFINNILDIGWKNTKRTRVPGKVLVPPTVFTALNEMQLPNTEVNVLNWIKKNSLYTGITGLELDIKPVKWLEDEEYFSTPRVVAYTNRDDVVRFPLVQLAQLPVQYKDFNIAANYYGALGVVEFVRPEMVLYGEMQ